MMKVAVLFVLILSLVSVTSVTRRFEKKVKPHLTAISRKQIKFCVFRGYEWSSGKVRFANQCMECTCPDTGDEYGCIGYGRRAGVVATPPGCRRRNDGCDFLFYKRNLVGMNVDCFTGKVIPGLNKMS